MRGDPSNSAGHHSSRVRVAQWLGHPHLPAHVAVLAVLLASPSLWFGLQVDDLFHRAVLTGDPFAREHVGSPFAMFTFVDGDPGHTREVTDIGFLPWWTLEGTRLSFFRPIAVMTHWIDYAVWPDSPVLMHIHNLLWFAGVIVLAALLYRRVLGIGWIAGLAALLYAIDDAHSFPAAWIANRNGLMAAFFGFATLLLHDRWRTRRGWRAPILGIVSLLLGLLSNEGAIAACAYLFAYAVFIDRATVRSRVGSLAPYAAVVVAWSIVYNLLGYGTWGSEQYIDPLRSPMRYLDALWMRLPVLLLGQWAIPPSDIVVFLSRTAYLMWWAVAVAVVLVLACVIAPVLRRNRIAGFFVAGMLLSLLPVAATFPMDRLLLFAGFGAMGLLAQFLAASRATGAVENIRPPQRSATRAVVVGMIALHLILAPVAFPLRILAVHHLFDELNTAVTSLPVDESVTDKTVVALSAPSVFVTSYCLLVRSMRGEPIPKRLRSLAPASMVLTPSRITRVDARTLIVEPDGGYRWFLVRDSDHPLPVGTRIMLTGMTAEVLELADEGWPAKVAFHFDVPLEDSSLVWVKYENRAFVLTMPPAVGETVELGAS